MWSSLSSGLLPLALLCKSVTADDNYNNRLDTTATNAGPLTTVFTPPASCAAPRTVANYGYPYLLEGCEGPYGDECCPEGWKYNAYFSPGRCPTSYKTCTLPTGAQRAETTAYCCPNGFDCGGQGYCAKSFNTISTMTYVDATLSTQRKIYGITASPIQIRFKAAQSTIVPVPTDSLSLPRRFLYTREKIGIGIAVPVFVLFLTIGFFWWRRRRVRRARAEPEPLVSGSGSESPSDDMPPPYTGPAAGSTAAGVDGRSMLERLTGGGKRPS
ncbi:hypothetical protein PENANT_c003G01640 [Penicillium antarcticum]|uniref:Uncharacterized protein n=1 Tax=Penicillium antarcticum TaxID=416450 RepID=A0A1V6QIH7_9EURO|nr:uncharacterized protein N7508_005836 [Penicillium antarcticum]KAJ5306821.1 hypothetical protein N7508_005836 [Penicillium antarcticum]OQD88747.1 hypothetical protein PENANT_c003G01640 [Penicillium antarcticum]